jgi:hypothetical protein
MSEAMTAIERNHRATAARARPLGRRWRGAAVAVAIAASSVGASGPVHAGGGWTNPVPLSPATMPSYGPVVVADATGWVTAVWASGEEGSRRVYASRHTAGSPQWGPVVQLSSNYSSGPLAAVADSTGAVTVLWSGVIDPVQKITSAFSTRFHPDTQQWDAVPSVVEDNAGGGSHSLKSAEMVVDAAGYVTAAIGEYIGPFFGGQRVVHTYRFDPGQSSWSLEDSIDLGTTLPSAQLVVDPVTADVVLAAVVSDAAGTSVVVKRRSAANGAWGGALPIATPAAASGDSDMVIDAAGRITLLWSETGGSGQFGRSARYVNGGWTAPTQFATGGTLDIDATVSPAGSVTAVWSGQNGGKYVVRTSTLSADSGWGAVTDLSTPADGDSFAPRIVYDNVGKASKVVVWARNDGTWHLTTRVLGPLSPSWSPRLDLANGSSVNSGDVVLDPSGNARAFWNRDGVVETAYIGTVGDLPPQ